jgi:hypothetical protein
MGIPTFKGKHNSNKCKVYILMRQEYNTGRWFRAKELHNILGIPLRSLTTSLPNWHRWGRIIRRTRNGYFEYRISMKGLKWFETWRSFIPIQRYLGEIQIWQSRNNPKNGG